MACEKRNGIWLHSAAGSTYHNIDCWLPEGHQEPCTYIDPYTGSVIQFATGPVTVDQHGCVRET